MADWIKYENARGIRYRIGGTGKKKDRYWQLIYKYQGKTKVEVLGWESEGWTEKEVEKLSSTLAKNRTENVTPCTFSELKALNATQREEAEILAMQAEEEAKQEAAQNITIKDIFDDYKIARKKEVFNERTLQDEVYKAEKWLFPHFGNIALSKITQKNVIDFINECKNPTQIKLERGKMQVPAPRSAKTINHYINLLSQIWNFAKEKGICNSENPFRTKQVSKAKPKGVGKRFRFLTKEQAQELLAAIKLRSEILYNKCIILLYTGVRPIELHNLKWSDIDFENKTIRVMREIKTCKGETRIIPFPDCVLDVLSLIKKEKSNIEDYIFPTTKVTKSGKLKSSEISDTFDRVVNELKYNDGITNKNDRIVPYTLRHTYASWLVQKGVPLYTVAKLLGHTTTEITNRYAHLAPDNLRAAVNLFND